MKTEAQKATESKLTPEEELELLQLQSEVAEDSNSTIPDPLSTPDDSSVLSQPVGPLFEQLKPTKEGILKGVNDVSQVTRSVLEGASLGLSELPISYAAAGLDTILEGAIQEAKGTGDFKSALDLEKFKAKVQSDIDSRRQWKLENFGKSAIGEMTGALTPGGLSSKLAKEVSSFLKPTEEAIQASKIGQAVSKVPVLSEAANVGRAAVHGAAQGVTGVGTQDAIEQIEGFKTPEEVADLKQAGILGSKIGAGFSAIPPALKYGTAVGKKAFGAWLGPSEDAMNHYMGDPEKVREYINEAKKVKGRQGIDPAARLSLMINDSLKSENQKLEAVQARLDEAKRAEAISREQYRIAVGEKKQQLRDDYALKKAEYDAAKQELINTIKHSRLPDEFTGEVVSAFDDVKNRLVQESNKSYDILEKQKGLVYLNNLPRRISILQKQLGLRGQLGSKDNILANQELERWKQTFSGYGEAPVSYPELKGVVQDLDADLTRLSDKQNKNDFNKVAYNQLMTVRRDLDKVLKENKAYQKQMETVYALAKLNEQVSDFRGKDPANIQSSLDALWKRNNPDANLIIQVGKATKRDFEPIIRKYQSDRQRGATKYLEEKEIAALSENEPMNQALAQKKAAERFGADPFIAPEQHTAWIQSADDLLAAQQAVQKIKDNLADIQPFMSEMNGYNTVKATMSDRNPIYRQYLTQLVNLTGKDFEREINAARTAEQFLNDYTRGSRNVNTWTFMAGSLGIGLNFDAQTAALTAGLGTAFGNMIDRYGPRMVQKVLDGYLKVGFPTVEKLKTVYNDIPRELRKELLDSFVQSVIMAKPENYKIAPEMRGPASAIIQADQSLTTIEKAKAKLRLERDGVVQSEIIQKMMLQSSNDKDKRSEMVKRVFRATNQGR